jgi:hypothetical protein
MKKKTAKATKWNGFIKRWRALHENRATLDFATAALATEIRKEFPAGASGDLQFREWSTKALEVSASTTGMLIRAVKVFALFPKESDWYDLGGWQSLQFLSNLKAGGRRKVVGACHKRVKQLRDKGGIRRTLSYTTVKNICYTHGVRADYTTGRPNRLRVEEDFGFVRNWLKSLYIQYDLPKPPLAVRKALKGSKLSSITDAIKTKVG